MEIAVKIGLNLEDFVLDVTVLTQSEAARDRHTVDGRRVLGARVGVAG